MSFGRSDSETWDTVGDKQCKMKRKMQELSKGQVGREIF